MIDLEHDGNEEFIHDEAALSDEAVVALTEMHEIRSAMRTEIAPSFDPDRPWLHEDNPAIWNSGNVDDLWEESQY